MLSDWTAARCDSILRIPEGQREPDGLPGAQKGCPMRTVRLARARAFLLWTLLFWPVTAFSQATLRGHVIDSELGSPLASAVVSIQHVEQTFTTDSLGLFEAPGLVAGVTKVTIRVIGYREATFTVSLPATGSVEGAFPLDFTGYRLPEVVVQARADLLAPRYVDFEQRRRTGMGAYLRWDDIEQRGFSSVGDALHTVRGVRMHCNQQTYECVAFMSRTPECPPAWWIDGIQVHSFQESTPVSDVYGIEIYRGPGEVPAEFSGSTAACGVIVIWTKSRPYRSQ